MAVELCGSPLYETDTKQPIHKIVAGNKPPFYKSGLVTTRHMWQQRYYIGSYLRDPLKYASKQDALTSYNNYKRDYLLTGAFALSLRVTGNAYPYTNTRPQLDKDLASGHYSGYEMSYSISATKHTITVCKAKVASVLPYITSLVATVTARYLETEIKYGTLWYGVTDTEPLTTADLCNALTNSVMFEMPASLLAYQVINVRQPFTGDDITDIMMVADTEYVCKDYWLCQLVETSVHISDDASTAIAIWRPVL